MPGNESDRRYRTAPNPYPVVKPATQATTSNNGYRMGPGVSIARPLDENEQRLMEETDRSVDKTDRTGQVYNASTGTWSTPYKSKYGNFRSQQNEAWWLKQANDAMTTLGMKHRFNNLGEVIEYQKKLGVSADGKFKIGGGYIQKSTRSFKSGKQWGKRQFAL